MKKLLIIAFFAPLFCKAQTPFVKVSTSFIATTEGDNTTAGFLSGGILMSNKTAIGIIGGYFKPNIFDKAATPVGIEFTYCNFIEKKIKPVVSVNAMYPIYSYNFSYTDGNGNDFGAGRVTGIIMAGVNAGVAFPVTEKQKILATVGYSNLTLRSNYKPTSGFKDNIGMFIFSIACFL
jgi:hypothetical protein